MSCLNSSSVGADVAGFFGAAFDDAAGVVCGGASTFCAGCVAGCVAFVAVGGVVFAVGSGWRERSMVG